MSELENEKGRHDGGQVLAATTAAKYSIEAKRSLKVWRISQKILLPASAEF
jgi:hypothetical protein